VKNEDRSRQPKGTNVFEAILPGQPIFQLKRVAPEKAILKQRIHTTHHSLQSVPDESEADLESEDELEREDNELEDRQVLDLENFILSSKDLTRFALFLNPTAQNNAFIVKGEYPDHQISGNDLRGEVNSLRMENEEDTIRFAPKFYFGRV